MATRVSPLPRRMPRRHLQAVEQLEHRGDQQQRDAGSRSPLVVVKARMISRGASTNAAAEHDMNAEPTASAAQPERSAARTSPAPSALPTRTAACRGDAERNHEGECRRAERDLMRGQRQRIEAAPQAG